MANEYRTVGRVFDLSSRPGEGTATCIIGDASDGLVGTFSVHVRNISGLAATITVKARSRVEQASNDDAPFLPVPYLKLNLNGAVALAVYDSAPITGDSIILIPATGLQIALDVVYSGGTGRIYWSPMEGAAA